MKEIKYTHLITFEKGNGDKSQRSLETENQIITSREWHEFTNKHGLSGRDDWVVLNVLTVLTEEN